MLIFWKMFNTESMYDLLNMNFDSQNFLFFSRIWSWIDGGI